jgi:diamine N-acetyltransferase
LPTIRTAQRGDAAPLAALAEATFRDAFSEVNTVEDMSLHCLTYYSEALQAAEIANPAMLTLLCEHGARPVGFAQLRWGEAPKCIVPKCIVAGAPGEIQRLYLVGDFHGKGVAQDLMQACLDGIALRRSDVVWLGVWERNLRAIAFYKKFGFVEVGEHIFTVGRDPQRDILMARPVSD